MKTKDIVRKFEEMSDRLFIPRDMSDDERNALLLDLKEYSEKEWIEK